MIIPHLTPETIWTTIGFFGQSLFSARFFIQWLASEKAKKSIMPTSFWYFSVLGGLTLFAYALYRQDPVFILGQSTGIFIYARNLYLIHEKNVIKDTSCPSAQKTSA